MGNEFGYFDQRVDDFLQHYGVKGMRWGVSRAAKKVAAGAKAYNAYTKKPLSERVNNELNAYKTAGKFVGRGVAKGANGVARGANAVDKAGQKAIYAPVIGGLKGAGAVKRAGGKVIDAEFKRAATARKDLAESIKYTGSLAKTGASKITSKKPAVPGSPEHETVQAILKKGGAKNLTNAEIQAVNTRLQLTQSFNTLTAQKSTLSKGNKIVKNILDVVSTADRVYKTTSGPTVQALKKAANK